MLCIGVAVPSKSSLEAFFKDNHRVAIGFSGGVDSSYLVHVAASERADALPVFIKTPFIRDSEQRDAEEFCRRRGIKMEVVDIDLYSDESVVSNGPDRCYHCKKAMFEKVIEVARENGCDVVADGTNASDPVDDRPGVRALRELGIKSPLRDSDLSKSAIRRISRMDRLETWNKQSNSCLATRIETGVRITPDLIGRVAASEDAVAALGFSGIRVRTDGRSAKVQFTKSQIADARARADEIKDTVAPYFDDVTIDDEVRDD